MSSWNNNRFKAASRDTSAMTCYLYSTACSNSPYSVGVQMYAYNYGALVSAGYCCGNFKAVSWCSNNCATACTNASCVLPSTVLVGTWMALADIPAGWVGPVIKVL